MYYVFRLIFFSLNVCIVMGNNANAFPTSISFLSLVRLFFSTFPALSDEQQLCLPLKELEFSILIMKAKKGRFVSLNSVRPHTHDGRPAS